tara:strand:+ start:1511 stop:1780 length:270 start_codon:yes stop_codon:yes gene_type:complete
MIHEEVKEQFTLGAKTFLIEGCHRDWNMLEGHEAPEGTLWALRSKFIDHKGETQDITGSGATKQEAMHKVIFMIGFKTGLDHIGRHLEA